MSDGPIKKRGRPPGSEKTPQPALGVPERPSFLDEKTGQYWDHYIGLFSAVPGLLSVVDGEKVGMVCVLRSRWEELEAEASKLESLFVQNPNGAMGAHPVLKMRDKAENQYLAAMSEFGMGPRARTGIRIDKSVSNKGESRMLSLINRVQKIG
jgi:phage terminase small subunit